MARATTPAKQNCRIRARRSRCIGHAEAEQQFLTAYRSARMPHAWLIGGERGIGKATLAYRMARFVLAHPEPGGGAMCRPQRRWRCRRTTRSRAASRRRRTAIF